MKSMILLFALFSITHSVFANVVDINIIKTTNNNSEYGLHLYGNQLPIKLQMKWPKTLAPIEVNDEVAKFQLNVENADQFKFILFSEQGRTSTALDIDVSTSEKKVFWVAEGINHVYKSKKEAIAASKKVYKLNAQWLDKDVFKWSTIASADLKYYLYFSEYGDVAVEDGRVLVDAFRGKGVELELVSDLVDANTPSHHGVFDSFSKFKIKKLPAKLEQMIKGQVVLASKDQNGNVVDITNVGKTPIIDKYFATESIDLGISFKKEKTPVLKVWAPTAKSVKVHFYQAPDSETQMFSKPMSLKEVDGIWQLEGNINWIGAYYSLEVENFYRTTGAIETRVVRDPYATSFAFENNRTLVTPLLKETPAVQEGLKTLEFGSEVSVYTPALGNTLKEIRDIIYAEMEEIKKKGMEFIYLPLPMELLPKNHEEMKMMQRISELAHQHGIRLATDISFPHNLEADTLNSVMPDYFYLTSLTDNFSPSTSIRDNSLISKMALKLFIDHTVNWIKKYKIDAVKLPSMRIFDQQVLNAVEEALSELTLEKDGIDGTKILIFNQNAKIGASKSANPCLKGMSALIKLADQ